MKEKKNILIGLDIKYTKRPGVFVFYKIIFGGLKWQILFQRL
jgi:hypothetical protein